MNMNRNKKLFAALAAFSVVTGSAFAADTIVDITINQPYERTGLELGTDSYARGEGSISTGTNSIAIGKGAVATGSNEDGKTIQQKLAENKAKLQQIEDKTRHVKQLGDELNAIKIREQKTIEAGIRVEQIRKSKENAKNVWTNAEQAWQNKVDGTRDAIAAHQAKLDDLNSRLTGVSQLTNTDVSTPDGLAAAARELKAKAEQGTSLNLSEDFYKDYVSSYYKALGDLRKNNKVISDHGQRKIIDQIRENPLHRDLDGIVLQYPYSSSHFSSSSDYSSSSYPYSSSDSSSSSSYSSSSYPSSDYSSYSAGYNSLGEYSIDFNGIARVNGVKNGKLQYNGETYQTYWNIKIDTVDQATYDKWNAAKDGWRAQIHDANRRSGDEVFGKFDTATNGKSTILFNMVTDMKFELVDLDYQICYYQGKYEETHKTQWLDKKKAALDKRQQKLDANEQTIKNKYKELFGKELENTEYLFYKIGQDIKNEWKQENIIRVEEKNKITTNKLTAELERELGINKNAIQEYERQIQDLRDKADQARRNYEGLNPSEEDLMLAREYERVAKELKEKADALKQESDELQNLKDNLKLNDLKNKGADAIAYGTNALVTGNAAIGLGKDVVVTGQDGIALGRTNKVSGTQSVAVGTDNTVSGNNTYVIGANVNTNAQNAVILGANSAGEDNTVSVGAAGKERRIIHVAAGTQDTDAVNLKQLTDATTKIMNEIPKVQSTSKTKIVAGDNVFVNGVNKITHDEYEVHANLSPTVQYDKDNANVITLGKETVTYEKGDALAMNYVEFNAQFPHGGQLKGDSKVYLRVDENNNIIGDLPTIKLSGDKADRYEFIGWREDGGELLTPDKKYASGSKFYPVFKEKKSVTARGLNFDYINSDDPNLPKPDPDEPDIPADPEIGYGPTYEIIGGEKLVDGQVPNFLGNKVLKRVIKATDPVKIKNLADGEVSKTSLEAVNGSQLYALAQNPATFNGMNKENWQNFLGDGANAAGNKGLVTGDTLYKAIQSIDVTDQISGKANTDMDNLTDAGKTIIRDLAKGSVKVANGENTTVTTATEGDATVYKVNVSKQAMQAAVAEDLAKKANQTDVDNALKKKADTNAGNLTNSDVTAWQAKLGTGEVADGNTGLVTGNTVYNTINNLQTTITADLSKKANSDATNIDKAKWQTALGDGTVTQGNTGLVTGDKVYNALQGKADAADVANKANTDMDNLTDAGKTIIRDLAKGSVKVANGENTTVTTTTEGDATVYKVNVSKQAMQAAVADDLNKKADKTQVATDLATKADKDAKNLTDADVTKWQDKLGTGQNKAGDKGLVTGDVLNQAITNVTINGAKLDGEIAANNTTKGVTGDKIYNALEKKADKSTVAIIATNKADKDAKNLTKNDVAAWQSKLGTGEVAQGNTGLVTGNKVYNALSDLEGRMTGGFATLDNKINQSGAMAAALAAMKPLDFDGTERTQISAAVGQYHGKHAVALGVYHYFSRDILLTGGLSWQGSDVMGNVGMTFRVGKRDERAISRNADVKALADEVIDLREQNRQMAAQMDALLAEVKNLQNSNAKNA